ncbi:glycosyltransferase [Lacisediminihabitans changchengi]|uniref:Glycosyltransferase family 1 protein n=1 Tax=Lacisediminihabitans changchengi TaxID=2787634 RepID=A0A934W1N8_9MICO|nr:glycosyltransferase [Lacisediminihabitans changchengi]MBK4347073.1 glycosyltransferase family 1 protein [Lacisediminihabitans changchengi]MBK4347804.1 glycosyltransferase family 1 protein [Lacisediminihabitans changchengi]
MKFLFAGVPAFGHLLPLAPLAAAARAAGHDTAVLTSGGMVDALRLDLPDTPVLAAGPMPDALFAEVARRYPGSDPARNPEPETVASFFAGARVDLTADAAITAARGWGPDVIIAEATDFVGPMVAAALGVPYSVLAFGPAVPPEFTAPMFSMVAERYASRELTPSLPTNYIDPTPPSLQQQGWVAPANHLLFGARPHSRPVPADYIAPPATPGKTRVLVTLGTVFSSEETVEAIIESIDLGRFDIVATVAIQPDDVLPENRDGVTFVRFVPLGELLRGVSLVVNSGGAGTVLASFSEALPMVIMPQGADQFINAAAAANSGAAVVVSSPSEVGAALHQLVDDDSATRAARRVADEMAAMPTPADVISTVVAQVTASA